MKVVILAGGYGTRLSEETSIRPKPMSEIGGMPILWHIMKIYSAYGLNDFIICCGYKGYMIKEYFANYALHMSDVTFDLKNHTTHIHQNNAEPWKVTLVNTGETSMTGGRIKRIKGYVKNETFCCTYGDGVTNLNMKELIQFHKKEKRLATVTAVQPPGRFGAMSLKVGQNYISDFREKPRGDGAWISGGFFVLEPEIFDYIENDSTVWEQSPMQQLATDKQLSVYRHSGFWQCMDTLRDKNLLENLWASGESPWKIWK